MCQINVVVEREGEREPVMESVTSLEVTDDGVVLATFFEEPLAVQGVHVAHIDFLGGTVVLAPNTCRPKAR